MSRGGADRDHDPFGGGPALTVLGLHQHGVIVDESGCPVQQVDIVAGQLTADHLDLAADHVLGAGQQILNGDVSHRPKTGLLRSLTRWTSAGLIRAAPGGSEICSTRR
jgi:hypothetical protein